MAIAATSLPMFGCAEIEVSAEAYKNLRGPNAQAPEQPTVQAQPPAQPSPQPVSSVPARPDLIEPSMQPDREAFHATGFAVWDGARTLPGIWIAHPMAETARRVRLTNGETGVRVDAAMFRRDPNLSGPRIVVSSAAAEGLGLAPGRATPITIEGLAYRVESKIAAVAVEQPEPAPADAPAQTGTIEPAGDPVGELAALEVTPDAAASPAPPVVPETAAAEPAAQTPASSGVTVSPPEPTAAGTDAGGVEALPVVSPPVPRPAARRSADPAPTAPGDITDGRHFIQAGVFGQPENATRLVEKLRAADLPASGQPVTLGERQFTRVLVGPYQTKAERDLALESVREIGPADATPTRG